ncbi:unnamed protein product [Linum tenue]|uniref:Uncharacterized protein n=1 Tax=Linum tenue TaxID=586396 RepID=A0AAV0RBC0_9ROSI|nr:unnamed protein product [Linum tenue]
MKRRREKKTL